MCEFSHLDELGQARMVDVSAKDQTVREAIAVGRLRTTGHVVESIAGGKIPKGDVLATARIAGIMGAKQTPHLIPMCHPLLLDHVSVDISLGEDTVDIRVQVRCTGRTGVEMEAMTGASVAALAVYDMCKALDRAMTIEHIYLEKKSGGKSGTFERGKEQ